MDVVLVEKWVQNWFLNTYPLQIRYKVGFDKNRLIFLLLLFLPLLHFMMTPVLYMKFSYPLLEIK